jgi:hypothetical protein
VPPPPAPESPASAADAAQVLWQRVASTGYANCFAWRSSH